MLQGAGRKKLGNRNMKRAISAIQSDIIDNSSLAYLKVTFFFLPASGIEV